MPEKPRVKAPRQRVTQKPKDADRQRRMLMYGGGALVALAAVFLLVVVLGLGGGEPSPGEVQEKVRAAGGTMRIVDALPGDHTLQPNQKGDWNTDPPTSGEHFGFDNNQTLGTAVWGAWDQPLQLARVVHNLEHGGIFIFYGDKVKRPVIAQLRAFYDEHQNGTLLAPYPKLGNRIALGAWVADSEGNEKAYLARLKKFDEDAFSAFFSAFQFKGPERFPEEALLPGQS